MAKSKSGQKSITKAAKATASVKTTGKVDSNKKLRKKKPKQSFSKYIHHILKQVHPELRISKLSMSIMNSFVNDTFERIAMEASNLQKHAKKKTYSAREIQTATRLVLSGELSKHAISEGTKAVAKFLKAR